MVQRLENGNDYCDCLDWNEELKEHSLATMNLFNRYFHTIGVTPDQQRAYYIRSTDLTEYERQEQELLTVKE